MQLSFSKLKTYLSCPKSYELQYIQKVKTIRPSEALKIGSEIHRALEKTFDYAKRMPLYDAFQLAVSELTDEMKNTTKVKNILEKFNPEMVFGKSIISAGASELKIGLTEHLMPSDFEKGIFRGIIDLIWIVPGENGLEANILDFKTNLEKTADILQLEFYAFLVKNYYKVYYPISKITVMFYYLMHEDPLELLEFEPSKIDDSKFLNLLNQITNDKEFRPNPSEACRYCMVAHACPLAREGIKMAENMEEKKKEELNEEEIKELAELYLPLKRAYELIDEMIRTYLEAHNQIVTKHFVIKMNRVTKNVIDPEYAKEVLKMANVSLDDIIENLNISQNLFKKLNINLPKEAYIPKEEYRLNVESID